MTSRMGGCLFSGTVMAIGMACIFGGFFLNIPGIGRLSETRNQTLGMIVLFGSIAMIVMGFVIPPFVGSVRQRLIQRTGKLANAEVIKVENSDFSSRDGGYVILKLTLLVKPDDEAAFEAVVEPRVSVLRLPVVGQTMQVHYDPKSHAVVMG